MALDKERWVKHAQRIALLSQWGPKADPKKTDKELFLTKGTALDPMQTMLPSTTPHPTVLRFLLDETGEYIVVSPQPGMPSADFEQYQDVFPFYKDAIRGQCDRIIIVTGCIIRLQPERRRLRHRHVVANPPVNPGYDMRIFSTCGNPCCLHPICGNHTKNATC